MSNILSQIGSAVKGKIDEVNSSITAEETARISADSTLTSNLASEASTARAAEAANASAISTEETRATAAEGVLTGNLSQEISDRQAAITAEATTRASADTVNSDAIAAESTRALAAEGTLTTNLSQEVSDRQAAVSSEASTRAAAISNLDTVKANLAGATFTGDLGGTNLTLSGNLTVQGTTTSIETVNSQVKDSLMLLNDGAASSPNNSSDVGLIMERGSSDDGNVAVVYDEGEDKFCMYKTSAPATSTDISSDDGSASLVPLKVSDVYLGADNIGSLAEFTAALNA